MNTVRTIDRPTNDHQTIPILPRVFRVLTLLVALLGVSVQVYQITHMYFRYSTNTNIRISVENEVESPAMSICAWEGFTGFVDIPPKEAATVLDPDEYARYLLYRNGTNTNYDEYYGKLHKKLFTLNRIFAKVQNVTYRCCHYRNPIDQRDIVRLSNGKGCDLVFEVRPYVTEDIICYRLQLINRVMYHFKQNMEGSYNPSLIFRLTINFTDTRLYLLPYLHSPDTYGSISRLYPTASLVLNERNYIRLTYGRYVVTTLPRPYQTKCRYASNGYTNVECLKRCSLSQMSSFGVLPYAQEYTDHDSDKYGNWSIMTLNDPRISPELYRQIVEHCVQACDQDCREEWYTTQSRELAKEKPIHLFSLRVDLPNNPLTAIEHKPMLLFNEYVIYLMSVFGTWFGISFLDLNPFKPTSGANNRTATVRDSQTRACVGCRQSQFYAQQSQLHSLQSQVYCRQSQNYCRQVMEETRISRQIIRDLIVADLRS